MSNQLIIEEECFVLAEEALANGEVPVGAVIVDQTNEIIAKARNKCNQIKNPLSHAEVLCIDQVISRCNINNESFEDVFKECNLLVTIEPCIMCARLLRKLKFNKVICGAANDRFGGCGTVFNVNDNESIDDPQLECVFGGLDSDRAVGLIKRFYEGENPNAPQPKPKRIKNKTSN